jgi:HNH endonuclease/AP2 domain
MKYIKLTKGKRTVVDDEDYEWLNKMKWYLMTDNYAVRRTLVSVDGLPRKIIWMHRLIINCPEKMQTDHVNGNGLDNRKENLRICTHQENSMNQKTQKRNKTSKYKGVYKRSDCNRWCASVVKDQKYFYLGLFKTENEAVKAYNNEAKKLFGEFAKLNLKKEGKNYLSSPTHGPPPLLQK